MPREMRSFRADAIVLKHHDQGEADEEIGQIRYRLVYHGHLKKGDDQDDGGEIPEAAQQR